MNISSIIKPVTTLAELAAEINADHEAGERASWKGVEQFRLAGKRLLQAKALSKAQHGHGHWLKWVEKNLRFTERQARRYMALAKSDVTSDLEDAWRILCGNDESAAHVSHNSGEQEWYTPPEYIEAARLVLGEIDLDPASSDKAQETVKAREYFTKDDDGLAQPWAGRVWLNPPYAIDLIGKFSEKLAGHFEMKDVTAAAVLVNNATETEWFRRVALLASCICFPAGRVSFLDADGNPKGAPLQGQAVIYLGSNQDDFKQQFRQFGFCAIPG